MNECLGCQRCEIATVTLRDGRVVCDHCDAYRLECEAREVLGYPLKQRRDYLAKIEEKRGKESADELKDEMTAQWGER